MVKSYTTITKAQRLAIEDLDLKRKKKAIKVMDDIRKRYKTKGKTSTEIIRNFRDTRYSQ